jgi:ribosomal protein S18 acetylase RimI-like enzyme
MHVVEIGRRQAGQAAELLTQALRPYPTMRWICRSERSGFERRLRAIYRVSIAMQRIEGQPTLGGFDGQRLVAAAILYDPGRELTLRSGLVGLLGSLFSSARSTMRRGHRYETEIDRHRPREPHHFLSVIGVRPDLQRRGYGRALMEAIRARADRDPHSGGVCLDTCDPDNRGYYESLGYDVIAECQTGPLRQWILFRPSR